MIEMHSKYDNMHIKVMFYALNCINNHVLSCYDCMLSDLIKNNLTDNPTAQIRFAEELRMLMGKVQANALGRNSSSLGRGHTNFTPNVTIYALVQCTRDLPLGECSKCISSVLAFLPQYFPYREMCRGVNNACYVCYDTKPFFFASNP